MNALPRLADQDAMSRGVIARAALAVIIATAVGGCFGFVSGLFAMAVGAGVTALGWVQARFAAAPSATASRLFLITVEIALVTAALFLGNPFGPHVPAPMVLDSPALLCLLALMTVNAASVRPASVWWSGACILACWALVATLTWADPTTIRKSQIIDDDYATLLAYLEAVTRARYLDFDVLVLQFASIAACTVILGVAVHRMRSLARAAAERYAARASLAAHFSAPVIDALLSSRQAGAVRRRPIAALECDLVGFTPWAARTDPEAVAKALRGYHGFVEACVFEHGGAVLKYVGDGVVAVFGLAGEAESAVGAALACAGDLVERWPAAAVDLFDPGYQASLAVGVDYGEALTGLVGEGRAMSLAVIGAPLTSASRLQAERGKDLGVQIGPGALAHARRN